MGVPKLTVTGYGICRGHFQRKRFFSKLKMLPHTPSSATGTMGASTPDFFRLFLAPGMAHCGGGAGPNVFDVATPLVNWVESNAPPERIEASQAAAGKVVRTRPLCVYPMVARYKGSGSVDEAANFACVKP